MQKVLNDGKMKRRDFLKITAGLLGASLTAGITGCLNGKPIQQKDIKVKM
jgi:hypothetical protein